MSITSEHDRVVDALRDSQGDMLHPEDFDLSPIGLAVRLLEHYKRRIHELETNSGGVTIAIHGESDDLVEVEGPCWNSGRMSDRGEYGAFYADNKPFLIVAEDLSIIARVYATYNERGAWMFALAGPVAEERPLGDDVWGVTTACADAPHSTLLTVHAPAGAFLVERGDRREIAAQRAVEGLEE